MKGDANSAGSPFCLQNAFSHFGGLLKVPREVVLPTQARVGVRHATLNDGDDDTSGVCHKARSLTTRF